MNRTLPRALLLLAFGSLSGFFSQLRAAPDYQVTLPSGAKNPSGLGLTIHKRGIDANGYRPIEIEVAPRPATKPLVADRQIRVVLEFDRYGSQGTTQISQVIELPEGSTGERATILAPQTCGWSQLSIRTYEGGEKLLDLSQDYIGWASTIGWAWTEARPAILFIDSHVPKRADGQLAMQSLHANGIDLEPTYDLPDVRPLLANFPDLNQPVARPGMGPTTTTNFTAPQISDTALLALIWPRSRTEMTGFQELRSKWLELSQFDVAVISLADLQQLKAAHPDRFTVLRDWLSTGPLLIVYGVGPEYQRLQALEQVLELPDLPIRPPAAESLRGWTAPTPQDNTGSLQTPFEDDGGAPDETGADAQQVRKQVPAVGWPESPPFVRRAAGFGCLVALASDEPFPGKQADWAWLFNSVPENHWQWFRRTGLSLQRTNDDYWKFLIPGVGEAPVIPFMVLVTLFAVVIGPLNFFWLRRKRRLYLLLLTVPAGAALVTVSLIAFAFASDGVRVRHRVRSFADLDQTTGRAAVWARQSYYAGLAPSQGLVFPADTAVYPLAYQPGDTANHYTTLLHWDGQQHLRRGFLSARTATQFMTCRATTSAARLIVREPSEAGAPLRVENRLGTGVKYVVVRTNGGQYFAGTAIEEGATKPLERSEPDAAQAQMRALAQRAEPADPADYNPRLHNDSLLTFLGGGRRYLPNSDSAAGDPMMSRSILETNLNAFALLPGTYLAIVEHSPLVAPGIPRAKEEASFHLIRGRY